MDKKEILNYYRKVAPVIVNFSQNREFVPVYWKDGEKRFGQRPNTIEYEEDLLFYVKKGATSFHVSEERWSDVMKLKEAKREKDLKELRIGWDFVIDIDAPDLRLSKIIGHEITSFYREWGIEYVVKYSGNKGFHIIVPWEEFPKTIEYNGETIELAKVFPEIPRLMISYIFSKIQKKLIKKLQKLSQEILGISGEELSEQILIDAVLISPRHLFRAPYSLHEKSWLASVPVDNINNFVPEMAEPSLIDDPIDLDFSSFKENKNVEKLVIASLLFKESERWEKISKIVSAVNIKVRIRESKPRKKRELAPCIKNILKGLKDGRKRAVFILINYFRRLGYDWEEIRRILYEWNQKNEEPLKEKYIDYQLEWHKRKEEEGIKYLPPNCNRLEYYQDMGVCEKDKNPKCEGMRNPLSYK